MKFVRYLGPGTAFGETFLFKIDSNPFQAYFSYTNHAIKTVIMMNHEYKLLI